ncbi:hypothetical protein DF196_05395 [Bifidobacterium callitrichidarum]|uniref:Uncharacterized protein n=1 Tax=Bifidobacterium callitrichidarum TaxID=2052941 RepID=A0A2U2NA97_9BIFI|nr:hypothetical protein DF196_05395 [Bifidobacterium callitrichidarum]
MITAATVQAMATNATALMAAPVSAGISEPPGVVPGFGVGVGFGFGSGLSGFGLSGLSGFGLSGLSGLGFGFGSGVSSPLNLGSAVTLNSPVPSSAMPGTATRNGSQVYALLALATAVRAARYSPAGKLMNFSWPAASVLPECSYKSCLPAYSARSLAAVLYSEALRLPQSRSKSAKAFNVWYAVGLPVLSRSAEATRTMEYVSPASGTGLFVSRFQMALMVNVPVRASVA